MPTIEDRLAIARIKRADAVSRERDLVAKLAKRTRAEEARMRQIIGTGAIAAGLLDQCLMHVSVEERDFVAAVRRKAAAEAAKPSEAKPTPEAAGNDAEENKKTSKKKEEKTAELFAGAQKDA